jgi:hypothetical protein
MSPTLEIRTPFTWIIIRLSSYVIVGFKNRELCHSATYCSITRLFSIFLLGRLSRQTTISFVECINNDLATRHALCLPTYSFSLSSLDHLSTKYGLFTYHLLNLRNLHEYINVFAKDLYTIEVQY